MKRKDARKLLRKMARRADWIQDAVEELEKLVKRQEREFAIEFYAEIMKELELDKGRIPNSAKNRRVIAKLNKINRSIQQRTFGRVVNQMLKDFNHIALSSVVYYGELLGSKTNIKPRAENIKSILFKRLGFNPDGTLIRDGYMQGLFESQEVTIKIKDYVTKSIFTSSGFEGFKKGLNQLIEGEKGKMGLFSRFYRNYAYDVYSQADSLQEKMLADELSLEHFVYSGGVIKTSRAFCIRKSEKVFSIDDTKGWEDEPDNLAKPPNYDPIIDRGGYGCLHKLNFITKEYAEYLGYGKPEVYNTYVLEEFANGGQVISSDLVDVNVDDYKKVYSVARAFAKMGRKAEIKPKLKNHLNPLYKEVYGDLAGTPYERKNPDLYIDGKYYEHEGFDSPNNKRAFKNMLNRGRNQASRLIIDKVNLTDRYMKRNIHNRVNNDNQAIEEVWVLEGKRVRLLFETKKQG